MSIFGKDHYTKFCITSSISPSLIVPQCFCGSECIINGFVIIICNCAIEKYVEIDVSAGSGQTGGLTTGRASSRVSSVELI